MPNTDRKVWPLELQAGDIMLYSPSDLVGYLIAIKTWTMLSHVECYTGAGKVIAARIQGVNVYSERLDSSLRYVRRPVMREARFDIGAAWDSVKDLIGKSYEIGALEHFFNPWAKHRHTSRVCSTIASKWLRGGGCVPFNPDISDEDISPAQLLQTPNLVTIWDRDI